MINKKIVTITCLDCLLALALQIGGGLRDAPQDQCVPLSGNLGNKIIWWVEDRMSNCPSGITEVGRDVRVCPLLMIENQPKSCVSQFMSTKGALGTKNRDVGANYWIVFSSS